MGMGVIGICYLLAAVMITLTFPAGSSDDRAAQQLPPTDT